MENKTIRLFGFNTKFNVDNKYYSIDSVNIKEVEDLYFNEIKRVIAQMDNDILTFEKELKQAMNFKIFPKPDLGKCYVFIQNITTSLQTYSGHIVALYYCARGNKKKVEMLFKHYRDTFKLVNEYDNLSNNRMSEVWYMRSNFDEVLKVDEEDSIFNNAVSGIQNSIYHKDIKSYDSKHLKGF